MTSHSPQRVDEARHGGALSVPGLPQVEDGLGGTWLGSEECYVSVDSKSLC